MNDGPKRPDELDADRGSGSEHADESVRGPQVSLSRRRLLKMGAMATGTGVAATAFPWTAHDAIAAGRNHARIEGAQTTLAEASSGPTVIVPPPTGNAAKDTANALAALDAPAGTTVFFQASTSAVYSINQELPVPQGVRVSGYGSAEEQPHTGVMPTLAQAAGTSLKCILASAGYLAGLYDTPQYNNGTAKTTADSGIEVDHLAFDGNNGHSDPGNTVGHGLVLYSIGSRVHDCYFLNIAESGVVIADANHAGTPCVDNLTDNRVYDSKVSNSGGHGIWVTATSGSGGCTDGYLLNNVLASPSKQAAMAGGTTNPVTNEAYESLHMDNAAGWWLENNHGYACPGGGMYFSAPWGAHISQNSVDSFGVITSPDATYTGYLFDFAAAPGVTQTRPAVITENKVQAYLGVNTNGPASPGASNSYIFYEVTMEAASWQNTTWVAESSNSAHPNSLAATPISGGSTTSGSTTVVVPAGSTAGVVQLGMSITDGGGAIPDGTTVTKVVGGTGSGSQGDRITISAAATSSSSSDTIYFPPATAIGWKYKNSLAGSTLVVHRTNDIVATGIDDTPALAGAGSVTIVDPMVSIGAVTVTGSAQANQILIATSPGAASWADPPATTSGGEETAVFERSGTYDIPTGASLLRVSCVGGGGGGGGGGSTATGAQSGGAGGAAGSYSEQFVSVGTNTTLQVVVGAGGSGGAGGPSGGGSGKPGATGAATTVSGPGISVLGAGGPGGLGCVAGSASVSGAAYGGRTAQVVSAATAGCGGGSAEPGGAPAGMSGGGGGGGGRSTSVGGGGGRGGSAVGGGASGSGWESTTTAGGSGADADGAGSAGGGGGGAAAGAVGGTGGRGAGGFVVVRVVG